MTEWRLRAWSPSASSNPPKRQSHKAADRACEGGWDTVESEMNAIRHLYAYTRLRERVPVGAAWPAARCRENSDPIPWLVVHESEEPARCDMAARPEKDFAGRGPLAGRKGHDEEDASTLRLGPGVIMIVTHAA